MLLQAIAFYVFAGIATGSALMVISSRNPVHSVLFLILAFFSSAGLFVLLGAELLAMLLVIVYVGAVAVLFLFVVMMLDVDFVELRQGFLQYLPIGAVIGGVMALELALVVGTWIFPPSAEGARVQPTPPMAETTNAEALGAILYTDYILYFQLAGMVLLVAMIGAIVLTLRQREGVRKQDIGAQVGRRREDAVEVVKVPTGRGI